MVFRGGVWYGLIDKLSSGGGGGIMRREFGIFSGGNLGAGSRDDREI